MITTEDLVKLRMKSHALALNEAKRFHPFEREVSAILIDTPTGVTDIAELLRPFGPLTDVESKSDIDDVLYFYFWARLKGTSHEHIMRIFGIVEKYQWRADAKVKA